MRSCCGQKLVFDDPVRPDHKADKYPHQKKYDDKADVNNESFPDFTFIQQSITSNPA